jgi:C4-dicarboxylate transporter DctQ subunit
MARFIDRLEENILAFLLAIMAIITFANVVARYLFNSNILWALEATVFLFAWMVLLGASYGVKKNIHIGVDIIINLLPARLQYFVTLVVVGICILFSLLLLKGGWDYWYPFATERAWLETNDIPMPAILSFLENWLNDGDKYEKIPRLIPYAILPLSMALLTFRFIQAFFRILTHQQHHIIASHEAEDLLEKSADADKGQA